MSIAYAAIFAAEIADYLSWWNYDFCCQVVVSDGSIPKCLTQIPSDVNSTGLYIYKPL